jgi:hypothetical protein
MQGLMLITEPGVAICAGAEVLIRFRAGAEQRGYK